MDTCKKMEDQRLKIYWDILKTFMALPPRINYKGIATKMGRTGRGRSPSTIYRHFQNMKERRISRDPTIILRPFEESQTNVYFCRKPQRDSTTRTFKELCRNKDLDYVLFLAGDIDYFITSRKDLNFKEYGVEIVEQKKLFTPIFTFPPKNSWKFSFEERCQQLLDHDFVKGNLERKIYCGLNWDTFDWNIYLSLKYNMKKPFNSVSRETGISHKTIKKRFYKNVLPNCKRMYYFFPKGYNFYEQTFLQIYTRYEKSLVNAFKKLATTTYVYPLKDRILVNCFHESGNIFMGTIKELEEVGIIKKYMYVIPTKSSDNATF